MNFQTYFDNLLTTIKELSGIEIEFEVVIHFLEVSESVSEFLSLLLQYILDEVFFLVFVSINYFLLKYLKNLKTDIFP